ncbi:MAG: histidinol dehydrogenase [Burkholderiaceae bacterium]|nr:histidinol dehydrogenase [Burkholderiaceae bacterium]
MRTPIRRLDTRAASFDAELARLQHWSEQTDAAIEERVGEIIADVRARGDAALLETTRRFDRLAAESIAALELSRADFAAAHASLPPAQRDALRAAADRIRSYHQRQLEACGRSWRYRDADGTLLGQKVTPLDRVGIYVPGGKAAYPSSVLMNALPAAVAGVGEIVMVVPTPASRNADAAPGPGERNPLVLAAAHLAGVTRGFTVGGAQAVAALAFGTASVPRVDKITGPGNAYVASAKRRVFGQVGIDMIAGPSEILVLADGSTPADWVAMDLFSQAEHDELAQSILLTPDAAYRDAVHAAIDRLLPEMPRQDVIRASLEGRGALVLTRSMQEACEIANRIAPEHLEISSREPWRWEPLLRHAGAIFLGAYTSESLGDYCAGPNHVLPTSGTARFSSPLSVTDFQKRSSLIEVSAAGAQTLGAIAAELADGEGLPAHARAARMRLGATGEAVAPSSASFEVRPVREADVMPLIKLETTPQQKAFVASNAVSLAQAAYSVAGRPFGLYADGEAVGFLLLYDSRQDDEEPADELYVWRLMIDARHQGRGHGGAAMRWVIEEARRMGVAQVGLSHVADNTVDAFYARFGFRHTGKIDDCEREMVLRLKEDT